MQRILTLVSIISVGNLLLETYLPTLAANIWNGCGMLSTANEQIPHSKEETMPTEVDVGDVAEGVTDGVSKVVVTEGVTDGVTNVPTAVATNVALSNVPTNVVASKSRESSSSSSEESEADVASAGGPTVAPTPSSSSTSTSDTIRPNDAAKLDALVETIADNECTPP